MSGLQKRSYVISSLMFLMGLALMRTTMKQEFQAQNNPEFDKKLKDIPATLVGKRLSNSSQYGEFYFSTDNKISTIEAYMGIPVLDEDQKAVFFEAKEGTKMSLLDWKKSFKVKKENAFHPYVKTVLIDK